MSDHPVKVWWWPLPPEGQTVPGHPPVELTGNIGQKGITIPVPLDDDGVYGGVVDLQPWAERLATAKYDPPPTVSIGDPADGPCSQCERCTWNPGPDCGKQEHPHCPDCGHCGYRHARPPTGWPD